MAMGSVGPFGRVFVDSDNFSGAYLWTVYPESYYTILKTPKSSLPVQSNGYDCGVRVILTILDLVVTQ